MNVYVSTNTVIIIKKTQEEFYQALTQMCMHRLPVVLMFNASMAHMQIAGSSIVACKERTCYWPKRIDVGGVCWVLAPASLRQTPYLFTHLIITVCCCANSKKKKKKSVSSVAHDHLILCLLLNKTLIQL